VRLFEHTCVVRALLEDAMPMLSYLDQRRNLIRWRVERTTEVTTSIVLYSVNLFATVMLNWVLCDRA
jgi:hypothetical protein